MEKKKNPLAVRNSVGIFAMWCWKLNFADNTKRAKKNPNSLEEHTVDIGDGVNWISDEKTQQLTR